MWSIRDLAISSPFSWHPFWPVYFHRIHYRKKIGSHWPYNIPLLSFVFCEGLWKSVPFGLWVLFGGLRDFFNVELLKFRLDRCNWPLEEREWRSGRNEQNFRCVKTGELVLFILCVARPPSPRLFNEVKLPVLHDGIILILFSII